MMNVMLVEDEMIIRTGMRAMVKWEENGFCLAAEAVNGQDGLEQLQNHSIDIAIVDINMPVMDGLTFIQKAKEQGYSGEFIILSSYDDFEFVKKAMVLGARDYIHKPTLTPDDVAETLNRVKEEILKKREQESICQTAQETMAYPDALFLEQMVNQGILAKPWTREQVAEAFHRVREQEFYLYVLQIPRQEQSRLLEYYAEKAEKRMEEFLRIHRENIASFQEQGLWLCIFVSSEEMRMEWENFQNELRKMELQVIIKGNDSPVRPEHLSQVYCKAKADAEEEGKRYKWENTLSSLVREVVEYIRENYKEEISLEKVVKRYHVNYSYFSRLFYKEVGESFTDYVTRVRMDQAKFLLVVTDDTISQIAEQSGYDNEKYFMKLFKKMEGCTPSEYRKKKYT